MTPQAPNQLAMETPLAQNNIEFRPNEMGQFSLVSSMAASDDNQDNQNAGIQDQKAD